MQTYTKILNVKSAVRKRDGHKCVRCGTSQTNRRHHVHRIVPGSVYAPRLCQTLCGSCHTQLHGRPRNPVGLMSLDEIRELLSLTKWTREELADKIGITRNTIDRWFCVKDDNQRHPSVADVEKMTAWLEAARQATMKKWTTDKKRPVAV